MGDTLKHLVLLGRLGELGEKSIGRVQKIGAQQFSMFEGLEP